MLLLQLYLLLQLLLLVLVRQYHQKQATIGAIKRVKPSEKFMMQDNSITRIHY